MCQAFQRCGRRWRTKRVGRREVRTDCIQNLVQIAYKPVRTSLASEEIRARRMTKMSSRKAPRITSRIV
jgi:hypothetical protein